MKWKFGQKKKIGGFSPKKRTRTEVDREYADHCIQIGHKKRLIDDLELEVAQHLHRLHVLNKEGLSLSAETPAAVPVEDVIQGNADASTEAQ